MAKELKLITRKELMDLTKKARGSRKQSDVAEGVEVSQSAISQAETKEDASLDDLRKKIIAHYLGIYIGGPGSYFKVVGNSKH